MNPPRLLITLGDVAGIGPEIVARAWPRARARSAARSSSATPAGSSAASASSASAAKVAVRPTPRRRESRHPLPVGHHGEPRRRAAGRGRAPPRGRAAYDFLCAAIDLTLAGEADGIVTCPLHKEGLHAAGVQPPGAHRDPRRADRRARSSRWCCCGDGIAVAHVTLHMALRDVFADLTPPAVLEKIRPARRPAAEAAGPAGRGSAVAALNPHASDGGLFGDEEAPDHRPGGGGGAGRGDRRDGPVAGRHAVRAGATRASSTASWRCTTTRGTSR